MTREMLLDLALGLGEEREIPLVAEGAGQGSDGERSGIPERVQQARPAAELADALGAPGEMVFLLARRLLERSPRRRVPRREALALVEGLRAHLADVINAH